MYHLHPPPPPTLSATSQQSRFHAPVTTSTQQAIDIRDITLTVGNQLLVDGADLRLRPSGRYGLVGRNGAGKSLLLQCVAHRWLPGVPDDVPIFYVDQMEDWGATGGDASDTVLDTVLGADAAAAAREREMAALEAGLAGGAAAAAAAATAYRRRRAAEAVANVQRRVDRTSGARGTAARTALKAAERALAAATAPPPDVGESDAEGAETAIAAFLAAELAALYEASEPPAERRARAETVLASMGFSPAAITGPVGTLSGGWRIRVALACARFVDAQVLLLDEPTNHLDLPGILDLKTFLNDECEGVTLLIVSHDRAFLDDTVDEIILLQARGLTYFDGNYSAYEQTVAEQVTFRARQRDALDRKIEKARASIAADRVRATRAADPKGKKIRAVASKERKLNDRTGVEVSASGHRFKLNRDRAGYHLSVREGVAAEHVEPDVVVRLPAPPPLRGRGPLLQAEGLSFSYGGPTSRPVLDGVTLCIEPRDRVAFWGANGEGKTTLLRLLAGSLAPRSGRLNTRSGVRVAHLEQHTVDDARRRDTSALTALCQAVPGMDEQAAYAALGGVGLHGAISRQPLSSLSGGQVMRWALARHVAAAPHVLLLDEPTNHLDIETGAALLDALLAFEGAVVVVAHDVHFLRALGQLTYQVAKGRVTRAAVPG
ncbi:hypothetical protein MMPV_003047 [Pyropia vietnamensis]